MSDPAYVNYHLPSQTPQAFRFDANGDYGSLESPELQRTRIEVEDLRRSGARPSFDNDSLMFLKQPLDVASLLQRSHWQSEYDRSIEELLKANISAKDVLVFDHTIRIDDPQADRRPARNVHTDYSEAGARQRLIDLLGPEKAQDYEAGHYAFVNLWRPIDKPVLTSPLGFVRPCSVASSDWMTIALIYPDRQGEILGLAANRNHHWFYLSQMTPDDVAVFNIYDNRGRPLLAHSALDLDSATPSATPRQSIETRALVRY